MNPFSLVLRKFRAFRMPLFSIVFTAFASYRSFTTGHSIQMAAVCAAIMPFFCQFKNFSRLDDVPPLHDVLASIVFNTILSMIYLGWMLGLGWLGKTFNPGYVVYPYFNEALLYGIAADVMFICTMVPICRELEPMQRLIPGLALTNGLLEYMKLADAYLTVATPAELTASVVKFSVLLLLTTLGLVFAAYGKKK